MAQPTREQVVERAEAYFDRIAYIWGGFPGTNTQCWCMNDGSTQTSSSGHGGVKSGPYIASDCSGYTSWCWYLRSHVSSGSWVTGQFSANYKQRTKVAETFEESFSGIQLGDVLVRPYGYTNPVTGKYHKTGHVAIYVGNNTILHCSTSSWGSTTSKHGMSRDVGSSRICAGYQGVCSYDSTWSQDYDPDEIPDPVEDWNQSDGKPGEPATPSPIMDSPMYPALLYNYQYTKRYKKMKHYRLF